MPQWPLIAEFKTKPNRPTTVPGDSSQFITFHHNFGFTPVAFAVMARSEPGVLPQSQNLKPMPIFAPTMLETPPSCRGGKLVHKFKTKPNRGTTLPSDSSQFITFHHNFASTPVASRAFHGIGRRR